MYSTIGLFIAEPTAIPVNPSSAIEYHSFSPNSASIPLDAL
jgi:hypothetical protein